MKKLALTFALIFMSTSTWSEFSCPDKTKAACLDTGDTVCPASAKCVGVDEVCLDKQSCDSSGFMCRSEYDAILDDYKNAVNQYDGLALENVALREERLARKNCVINAATFDNAIRCVKP